jgi:asparagine synthase (glutamine-hydrolysing)
MTKQFFLSGKLLRTASLSRDKDEWQQDVKNPEGVIPGIEELRGANSAFIPQIKHPDDLAMYADKLSMAHSLEARGPYLDRRVVEYVRRLDSDFKIRKWHRQAVALMFGFLKQDRRGNC